MGFHTDWLKYPDQCWAAIEKGPRHNKEQLACEKPAIAVAIYDGGEELPHAYPVCKHHSRGRKMLSLPDLIQAVKETA